MNVTSRSAQLWLSAFLPPILWAGVIFVLSSQQVLPGLEEIGLDFILKKIAHMFVYFLFYILLFRAFNLTTHFKKQSMHWSIPLLICLIYAISDEIHQSLVPGRYPTVRDIGYDMLGASVALLKTSNCI